MLTKRTTSVGKRARYKNWAADDRIFGVKKIYDDPEDPDPNSPHKIYYYRSRKARRAQARLDNKRWRDLPEHERLTL